MVECGYFHVAGQNGTVHRCSMARLVDIIVSIPGEPFVDDFGVCKVWSFPSGSPWFLKPNVPDEFNPTKRHSRREQLMLRTETIKRAMSAVRTIDGLEVPSATKQQTQASMVRHALSKRTDLVEAQVNQAASIVARGEVDPMTAAFMVNLAHREAMYCIEQMVRDNMYAGPIENRLKRKYNDYVQDGWRSKLAAICHVFRHPVSSMRDNIT